MGDSRSRETVKPILLYTVFYWVILRHCINISCYLASEWNEGDNAGEMSPGSRTESYPAFARIGLRENPGKNLNQVDVRLRGPDYIGMGATICVLSSTVHQSHTIEIRYIRAVHPVFPQYSNPAISSSGGSGTPLPLTFISCTQLHTLPHLSSDEDYGKDRMSSSLQISCVQPLELSFSPTTPKANNLATNP
ncbi:hypothetical protein ANN_01794 [Periplaneta americana]|uniref:Uncharacterized protein n=1 Tax=Periplaneta americana TaxID=6978 RepID=A0ABQ8TUL5_PERAM|nr:hypothetical protein ANN_01794 [Periplaneta americana]